MALAQHIVKALAGKADEVAAPLARTLEGPLLPKKGKYYPKPPKVKGKNDAVQHEANAIKYLESKGNRKAGDVNFMDDKGESFYMNKSNDNLQYTNLNTKKKNNQKLEGRRADDMEIQTMDDTSDFYAGAIPGTQAHHIAGLDQYGWLFDGLNREDQLVLGAMIEKSGIPLGNSSFNRADLSADVHTKLHSWMNEQGMTGRRKKSIKNLSLEDRMEFMQDLIQETRAAERQMYKLRQQELENAPMLSLAELHDAYENSTRPELYNFNLSSKPQSKGAKPAKKAA